MRTVTHAAAITAVVILALPALAPVSIAQDAEPESARTWHGRAEQIEQFIRDAEVVDIENIGVGVTNPKRADLAPGGLIDRIAFKPIRPGNYNGHFESYTSEIAAYELDKFLELGLTPPTVEKRIGQDVGAAVMWASPSQSFKDLGEPPSPPTRQIARWSYQLIRAKMFHNLIYNKDPNLGNWLVDPAWNLILIDNSRAFTNGDSMVHELNRIDRDLWDRFQALDETTLTAALGEWLEDGAIREVLKRRDKMAEEIQTLVDTRGEAHVFVSYRPPAASPPSPTTPAEPNATDTDEVASQGLLELGGQLLSALDETPVVLAGSELTWVGTIVPLSTYTGPHTQIAEAAMKQGHEFGIATEFDGLLSLTRDPESPEHYEMVAAMPGKRAEVFGLIAKIDGLSVVQVTLCRESP